ncbi:MAG: hypothetical protein ACKO4T_09020 [Planctomycetaceae bacterium]
MNAISRMSPPQFGHSSGNSSPTRAISFAQAIREVSCEARDRYLKALEVTDRLFADPQAADAAKDRIRFLRPLAECHRQLGEEGEARACEARIAKLEAAAKGGGQTGSPGAVPAAATR